MPHISGRLFARDSLRAVLDNRIATAAAEIAAVARNSFVASSDDQLVAHVLSKLSLEPVRLLESEATMETKEASVDVAGHPGYAGSMSGGPMLVPGVQLVVEIPFTGYTALWFSKPDRSQTLLPSGGINERNSSGKGLLTLSILRPSGHPREQFKRDLEMELQGIRFHLTAQEEQLSQWHRDLEEATRTAISRRRQALREHEALVELIGIPLARREQSPDLHLALERTLVKPALPLPSGEPQPEYGIRPQDYEHILDVIRHVGRTFESTPKTYSIHDEEELRDILLAHLNGHYKGAATGETFRGKGKTDIRIEAGDRSAFVAECKVWHGQSEVAAALEQLADYTTWRDCKAALILFNKSVAQFTQLVERMKLAITSHRLYKSTVTTPDGGELRFVIRSKHDEHHLIQVHAFVFNLFIEKGAA